MKIARQDRSLIAWMLLACVLLNLFACGLHHGQMSALSLSGLEGGFCSAESAEHGSHAPSSDGKSTLPSMNACPLCSSASVAVAINSNGWLVQALAAPGIAPLLALTFAQPPPRYLWPSINPRASP